MKMATDGEAVENCHNKSKEHVDAFSGMKEFGHDQTAA